MKNVLRSAFVAALVFGTPVFAAAQGPNLQLSMQGGRVTLVATDVPVRAILQEWSRIGQTKIVNADKLTGPNLTLQLVNKTEREVLDILLRSAAGYMAAPRPEGVDGVSAYDRITILATSRAPAVTAGPLNTPQPFQRPPVPTPVADEDDEPVSVNVPPQQIPQPPPGMSPFPGTAPPVAPFATPTPQIEGSQPRFQPGMMPTQQPGQQPMQPTQPMTSPRPGMLPQPPQNGINPYQQPGVARPGGPGGEGGE
jgi:hypothetical protein